MAPDKDGDRQAIEAEDKPTGVMTPLVLLVVFIITPFYIVAKTRSVSKEEPSNMYIYNVVRKKFSFLYVGQVQRVPHHLLIANKNCSRHDIAENC